METVKVLELSGLHIGKKVRVTFKLKRANAKLHKYEGFLWSVTHKADSSHITMNRLWPPYYWSDITINVVVPFDADVEFLDD